MLVLDYKARELWDASKEEYIYVPEQKLLLEHSLVSISKWESEYKKSFLSNTEKNLNETLYYIKCMNISKKEIDDNTIAGLTHNEQKIITSYIEESRTATTIKRTGKQNRDIITSEQIYCWMIQLKIPSEYQKWHLSRLLTLIEVLGEENAKASGKNKKMTKAQILAQNAEINAARKAQSNSKG